MKDNNEVFFRNVIHMRVWMGGSGIHYSLKI